MKLVLNNRSSESHSGNPVQLCGLQVSSCVEEISSRGKSMNSHLLQIGRPSD